MKKELITNLIKSINLCHLENTFYELSIQYNNPYIGWYYPTERELAFEICDLAEMLLDNELDEITSDYFRIYRGTDDNGEEILKFMFCYNFPKE
jgi:hypothetical protein